MTLIDWRVLTHLWRSRVDVRAAGAPIHVIRAGRNSICKLLAALLVRHPIANEAIIRPRPEKAVPFLPLMRY